MKNQLELFKLHVKKFLLYLLLGIMYVIFIIPILIILFTFWIADLLKYNLTTTKYAWIGHKALVKPIETITSKISKMSTELKKYNG